MFELRLLVYIGFAGFLGAISRFFISGWVYNVFGSRFPYGTLLVNVLGSMLLGFVYTLSIDRSVLSPEGRMAITVGFLGSLTTFSTFSLETYNLLNEGSLALSLTNILLNVTLSLAAVTTGIAIGKVIQV